jgi:uncharacterized lipoprotein YajG
LNARVVKPMRRLLFLAAVLVLAGCEPIPAARAQAVSLDTDKMVQEKEIAAVEAARRSRRERLKSAIAAVYRVDKGIKITVSKEK